MPDSLHTLYCMLCRKKYKRIREHGYCPACGCILCLYSWWVNLGDFAKARYLERYQRESLYQIYKEDSDKNSPRNEQ